MGLFCWDSIRTRGGSRFPAPEMDAAWEEILLPLITFPMIGRDLIDFGWMGLPLARSLSIYVCREPRSSVSPADGISHPLSLQRPYWKCNAVCLELDPHWFQRASPLHAQWEADRKEICENSLLAVGRKGLVVYSLKVLPAALLFSIEFFASKDMPVLLYVYTIQQSNYK